MVPAGRQHTFVARTSWSIKRLISGQSRVTGYTRPTPPALLLAVLRVSRSLAVPATESRLHGFCATLVVALGRNVYEDLALATASGASRFEMFDCRATRDSEWKVGRFGEPAQRLHVGVQVGDRGILFANYSTPEEFDRDFVLSQ